MPFTPHKPSVQNMNVPGPSGQQSALSTPIHTLDDTDSNNINIVDPMLYGLSKQSEPLTVLGVDGVDSFFESLTTTVAKRTATSVALSQAAVSSQSSAAISMPCISAPHTGQNVPQCLYSNSNTLHQQVVQPILFAPTASPAGPASIEPANKKRAIEVVTHTKVADNTSTQPIIDYKYEIEQKKQTYMQEITGCKTYALLVKHHPVEEIESSHRQLEKQETVLQAHIYMEPRLIAINIVLAPEVNRMLDRVCEAYARFRIPTPACDPSCCQHKDKVEIGETLFLDQAKALTLQLSGNNRVPAHIGTLQLITNNMYGLDIKYVDQPTEIAKYDLSQLLKANMATIYILYLTHIITAQDILNVSTMADKGASCGVGLGAYMATCVGYFNRPQAKSMLQAFPIIQAGIVPALQANIELMVASYRKSAKARMRSYTSNALHKFLPVFTTYITQDYKCRYSKYTGEALVAVLAPRRGNKLLSAQQLLAKHLEQIKRI